MDNTVHLYRIWLWGAWAESGALLRALFEQGYLLTLTPPTYDWSLLKEKGADLLLAASLEDGERQLPAATLPWILWNQQDDPALTAAAYQAGALAVLPADLHPQVLLAAVQNALSFLLSRAAALPQRHYRKGEPISLAAGAVLWVEKGVVAMNSLHEDGTLSLLGLYGPGFPIVGHGDDHCAILLMAHSDLTVQIEVGSSAQMTPYFALQMQSRVAYMEAWAAMLARPHLEQRLLGLLTLLAEQFGQVQAEGLLVNIRLTHEQLAAAIGCTRTSVTRILSNLRHRRLLITVSTADGERFCLAHWDASRHGRGEP
jgi:CRP-like cAMP-binding protein